MASAQTVQITGKVTMRQADSSSPPVFDIELGVVLVETREPVVLFAYSAETPNVAPGVAQLLLAVFPDIEFSP